MDEHVNRALELGIGFLLFVIALSTFLVMNQMMVKASDIGYEQSNGDQQIGQTTKQVSASLMTKSELYYVLTNDDFRSLTNSFANETYSSATSIIAITIDGVVYPSVHQTSDKKAMVSALLALPSNAYGLAYEVNEDGQVVALHFTGR